MGRSILGEPGYLAEERVTASFSAVPKHIEKTAVELMLMCAWWSVMAQWVITGEERSKHDVLFLQQSPVGGYLSGQFLPGCLSLCLSVSLCLSLFVSLLSTDFDEILRSRSQRGTDFGSDPKSVLAASF